MARVSKDVLGAIVDFLRQNSGTFSGSTYSLAKKLGVNSPSVYMALKSLVSRGIVSDVGGGNLNLGASYLSGDEWRWRKNLRRDKIKVMVTGVEGKSLTSKVSRPDLKNLLGNETILKELAATLQNLCNAQGEILRLQGIVKEQGKVIEGMEIESERLREEAHRNETELRVKVDELVSLDLQVRELMKDTRRNAAAIRKFDSSGIMIVPGE